MNSGAFGEIRRIAIRYGEEGVFCPTAL